MKKKKRKKEYNLKLYEIMSFMNNFNQELYDHLSELVLKGSWRKWDNEQELGAILNPTPYDFLASGDKNLKKLTKLQMKVETILMTLSSPGLPLSKKEFVETNPDSVDILSWNNSPSPEKFTKKEFLKTKPSSREIVFWNKVYYCNELVTKKEFLKTKPSSEDILEWNKNRRNKSFTKPEFLETNPEAYAIKKWNDQGIGDLFNLSELINKEPSEYVLEEWEKNPNNPWFPDHFDEDEIKKVA